MKTIKDLAPKTFQLVLHDPVTKEPLDGATLTIVGTNSIEFYNAQKDVLREKDFFTDDFDVTENENLRTLSACVVGWNNEFWGEELTPERIFEYVSDPNFTDFLRKPLERSVHNNAHFFRTED